MRDVHTSPSLKPSRVEPSQYPEAQTWSDGVRQQKAVTTASITPARAAARPTITKAAADSKAADRQADKVARAAARAAARRAALDMDETPLSREEAAAFLNYSVRTLNNLATLEQGPRFYSSGKKVFYLKQDLLIFVRSLRQGGSSAA